MRYQYVQKGAPEPDTDQKNARVLPGNIYENLAIRELLMALLDDAGKRRFEDQTKTNTQRFMEYDADLRISFQTTKRQIASHRWLITTFQKFLGEFPPSATLAKLFLADERFSKLKPRSAERYYRIIKRFLDRQCGIFFEVKIPKVRSIPEEVEKGRVSKLVVAIGGRTFIYGPG